MVADFLYAAGLFSLKRLDDSEIEDALEEFELEVPPKLKPKREKAAIPPAVREKDDDLKGFWEVVLGTTILAEEMLLALANPLRNDILGRITYCWNLKLNRIR